MNWALKYYDADHDILLEPDEAQRRPTSSASLPTQTATGG